MPVDNLDEFIRLVMYKYSLGVEKSNEFILCQVGIGEANALEIDAVIVSQIDATSRSNVESTGQEVTTRLTDTSEDLESTDPVTETTSTTQVSSTSGSNSTQTVHEWEDLS